MSLIKTIKNNLSNLPGWRTDRKIVVIESDDWGSIRMPSKEVLFNLDRLGYIPKNDYYNRFDSLASEQDLAFLFETLSSVKDKNGNPAVMTANTIVANPDFNKIAASNFEEYHYELFTKTLKKYPKHSSSFDLWKEGMRNKLFHPQFHGRDHVSITRWMNALQNNNSRARIAFNHDIFGLRESKTNMRDSFMRALDYENQDQFETIEKSLIEGLEIFKKQFGYYSKSFIAPSYVWDNQVEKVLNREGVKYLQGIQYQYYPKEGKVDLKKMFNYTGRINKLNQTYLVRNAFLESTLTGRNNTAEKILKRIEIAFKWKKPAIISSHRINYIGFIDPKNRDTNLILLKNILKNIIKKWPEVEFMTSDQLGDLIANKQ